MTEIQLELFPKIVCICGSPKTDVVKEETLKGYIVLARDVYNVAGAELKLVDNLQYHKIDMADEVLIINHSGYMSDSTKKERLYAIKQKKPLRYLEPEYIDEDIIHQ